MGLKVRGMALLACRAYVKERFGEAGWTRLMAQLPPDHQREVWNTLVLSTGWYEVRVFDVFLDAAQQVFGAEDPRMGRGMGDRIARADLKFYHSLVMPLLSPARVLGAVSRIWPTYWSQGGMSVVDRADKSLRIVLDNPGVPPLLCGAIAPGWGATAIELTRTRCIRVDEVQCVRKGAATCEYIAEWE
jgi:hypothetical protein